MVAIFDQLPSFMSVILDVSHIIRNHKNSCHGSAVEENNQTPHIWVNLQLERVVSHLGWEPLPKKHKNDCHSFPVKDRDLQ